MTVRLVESGSDLPVGLCETHVESFLMHLRATGYAERTVRKKRCIAVTFAEWTQREQVRIEDLNDSHISAFLKLLAPRQETRVSFSLAVLRLFMKQLREANDVPSVACPVESSPVDELQGRYVDYLREERGLAENSIRVYTPYVGDFLAEHMARSGCVLPQELDASTLQTFVLDRVQGRSAEYCRLLITALRSFLRFLYLCGETASDLSGSVPSIPKRGPATVPACFSLEELERVLAATDQSTLAGRRDYAILLLLSRLGLRAGEIVAMELDDIDWRRGEIMVRGKGRRIDHVPLLSDVGDALAQYLSKARGQSASRRVFLRMLAPRVDLSGPAAIGHIVRRALARAGVCRRSRGAAHLFRHTLATRMIRHGASIGEISEVLRHRSQKTTEIYAKVAFESLRAVAGPWPGKGGAQ